MKFKKMITVVLSLVAVVLFSACQQSKMSTAEDISRVIMVVETPSSGNFIHFSTDYGFIRNVIADIDKIYNLNSEENLRSFVITASDEMTDKQKDDNDYFLVLYDKNNKIIEEISMTEPNKICLNGKESTYDDDANLSNLKWLMLLATESADQF